MILARRVSVVSVLFGFALLLATVSFPVGAGGVKMRVAVAFPGIINDKSWNEAGYAGLKLVEKELGAEIAYTERVAQADQAEVMSDYARRGFNPVMAHGGEFSQAGEQVAERFPNTKVVVFSGTVKHKPNLATIRVNFFQVNFLGGVVAAMMTKSNKVAMVVAQKFPVTEEGIKGFTEGAQWANSKVQVSVSFTGSWDDAAKAKEATLSHIARGADVVFSVVDHAVLGVVEAVKEKNVYVVGQAGDQLDLAPKHTLTSAVLRMAPVYLHMAKLIAAGKFEGKSYILGLDVPEASGLGRFGAMVPQNVKDKAEDARKQLIAGKIKPK